MDQRTALVTGATGYVGGLVCERLLHDGWRVRTLTRDPAKLAALPWADDVEAVAGDAEDHGDVARALVGVDVAWYLLHSMGDGDDFVARDRQMARTFAEASAEAGVRRIVYLGGLHPDGELSDHLASRVEVGQILMASGVPTAVLQAGVVLGDESSSFEMLRHLSERLPAAVAPDWINNQIQPIAAPDVVHYLVGAADLPSEVNRAFDIGGPEALSYADMMRRYARARGMLPRLVTSAPVTTPRLAASWIGLVTPIPSALARPLIGSLLHDTVVKERDIHRYLPEPPGGLTGFDDAVREAASGARPGRWWKTLVATSGAVAATAVVGSLATAPGTGWYQQLSKPRWQPPAWAFPVAWTALYADIAVISALTIADAQEQDNPEQATAYARALALNLVLNAGWSVTFFRAHRLGAATLVAAALAASSTDLARRAAQRSAEKGVALAPYAAWTTFATALTGAIWARNRGSSGR